ncbi:MAG: hypothetical protein KME64_40075 [Scytonematopsis contorta HA4267-MV1]|nr:hypothetical protein [Scytonematopsis contorta HA4267-MV1]
MGSGELGVGSGELGVGKIREKKIVNNIITIIFLIIFPTPHSPLPTPYSPLPTP